MTGRKSSPPAKQAIALAAAYRVNAARRELAAARACFAEATRANDTSHYLSSEWEGLRPAIQKARGLHRLPGVMGTSLGHRIRDGVPDPEELVITVLVRKKIHALRAIPVSHRIPKTISGRSGGELSTDVIETGEFCNAVAPGLTVGLEIIPDSATISCFARDADGAPVALTVMHLITDAGIAPNRGLRFVSPGLDEGPQPLGHFLRGTLTNADAMAIALDPGVPHENEIPAIGTIRGARPVIDPGDRFIAVRMHGAVSGRRVGRIESCSAALPDLGLESAILVSIEVGPGDSGAVIVDNDGFVLGMLKGFFDGGDRLAVFSPIGAVLNALRCTLA